MNVRLGGGTRPPIPRIDKFLFSQTRVHPSDAAVASCLYNKSLVALQPNKPRNSAAVRTERAGDGGIKGPTDEEDAGCSNRSRHSLPFKYFFLKKEGAKKERGPPSAHDRLSRPKNAGTSRHANSPPGKRTDQEK